ncbi:hypothetical protein [Thiothrix sp.]|uniref:hypothetical protein n=1 Tax=Thiothrix sp. TaxID=1032 RepID=UPI00257E5012|nr:hypothetical protein [Thiothrix sp.]
MSDWSQTGAGLGAVLGKFLAGGGQADYLKGQSEGLKLKTAQMEMQAAQRQNDMAQQMADKLYGKAMERSGGASGLSGLSPNDVAAYALSGGTGADALANMYKWQAEGIKRDAGSYYMNPTTGQTQHMPKLGEGMTVGGDGAVFNAPGYTNSLYGQEKAKAEAADWLDDQKQYRGARLDDRQYHDPLSGNMLYTNRLATSGNAQYPEYRGGAAAGGVGQAGVQQPMAGGAMIAAPSESDKAIRIEKAKYLEAQRQASLDSGSKSAKQLARLNQLELLANDGLKVGGLAPVYQSIGGVASSLGIDIKGVSDLQLAEKVILQLAQDIPLPPGAASNLDVQQRLQSLPSRIDTPEAFSKSVKALADLAKISVGVSEYIRIHGHDDSVQSEIDGLYSSWGAGGKQP